MIYGKNCFSRLQEGQFMLSKNLIFISLLMLINFHILAECVHGECVPIVCWLDECDPNYYGILGCKEEDENAMVKGVSFLYLGVAGTGKKQFLPNYGRFSYTIKLANSVVDGTIGELDIYTPKSSIPDSSGSSNFLVGLQSTSKDNELKFEIDPITDFGLENYLILGNLSNKLLIEGETFEFEGPYMAYNIDLANATIKPTDDGRYIDRITIRTRANEDMSFRLMLNKKGTDQVAARFGRQLYYRLDKFPKNFTDLAWVPGLEGKKIEYLDGIDSYDIDLDPIK